MERNEDINSFLPIWIQTMFYILSLPFYRLNYFVYEEYEM